MQNSPNINYPIGKPGVPWGMAEKQSWRDQQHIKRSYAEEVLEKLADVPSEFQRAQYGALPQDESRYPLYAFLPKNFDASKKKVLITGGVHGYETSGVLGAIEFLNVHASQYLSKANIIVVPCVSPWGFESINRWNIDAIDPNRSFSKESHVPECFMLMRFVESLNIEMFAHFDLHETTNTDNSEFRPALAARDGVTLEEWEIPDGFYTVADTSKPCSDFQAAIIASVEQVTHIAPADDQGRIIGAPTIQKGVICYDKSSLHLCGGFTGADFVTTTEVYPDSPKASPQNCIDAQVAAIVGGLDYLFK